MAKRETIKTTARSIVKYWSQRVSESDIAVDWSDALDVCWMCGEGVALQRCHIVPDSLGGEDVPSNLVLLCEKCHKNAPNIVDPDFMWTWIRMFHKTLTRNTDEEYIEFLYWKLYGHSFDEDIKAIGDQLAEKFSDDVPDMADIVRDAYKDAGIHFGQGEMNCSTKVGVRRLVLKRIVEKYDLQYDIKM